MTTRLFLATVALTLSLPADAASITNYILNQPGPDSLAFVIDSIATSASTGTFNRYRISDNALSSIPMAPCTSATTTAR